MSQQNTQPGYRSLFWPIMLISIGAILLLSNLGIITMQNVVALLRMWPLLLIFLGLDLLFGRRSPILGALIGLGAVVVAGVIMLVGPSIGLAGDWEVKSFKDQAALNGAETADVTLELALGKTNITSLSDSPNLIEADVRYIFGEIELIVSGDSHKIVELNRDDTDININGPFDFLGWLFDTKDSDELYWDIGLNERVLLDLIVQGGVGEIILDLSKLNLSSLELTGGAGTINLDLPRTVRTYDVQIMGGVGETKIYIPDGAALNMQINGGIGGVTIDVPRDAAVRVEVTGGLKSVDMPPYFDQLRQDKGPNGIWETPNFDSAEKRVIIEYEGGLGQLTIN